MEYLVEMNPLIVLSDFLFEENLKWLVEKKKKKEKRDNSVVADLN